MTLPLQPDPLRVMFDAHQLGSRQAGNETYVRGVLTALRRMPELSIIAAIEQRAVLDPLVQVPVRRRIVPAGGLARLAAMSLSARSMRVDVVNAIYFAPVLAGAPLVLSVHDVSYEIHPEFFQRREVYRNRVLVREGARRARIVTTISETSRRALIERYGLRPERVVAILCGVSEPFLHAPVREVEPIGDRPLRLLAVGNLQPRKNLPRLLEAVRIVARRRAVRLRVVGAAGFQADSIRAALESSADVQVLGYVSEPELVGEYDAADMLVYPSIYEGFGLPVVEAMARGLPVITSTGGALPEVAADAAVLVDPFDTPALADAILRLADDDELRRTLVARGLQRAAAFTWTAAADALRDVYRLAAGG